MRHAFWLGLIVAACAPAPGARAQARTGEPPRPGMEALLEELRLFQLLNALGIRPDQARRMAGHAASARAALERLAAEDRAALERLRPELLAARRRLAAGSAADDPVIQQAQQTLVARGEARQKQLDALIGSLAGALREILEPAQVERIREGAIPDTWNGARPSNAPMPARSAAKQDEDIAQLVEAMTRLRATAGTPEGAAEAQKFLRSLVRDAPPRSREYRLRLGRAEALLRQALALPPAGWERQKLALAAAADRLLQEAMEADRLARGRVGDPYRWFAQEVLLHPQAGPVLVERGGIAPDGAGRADSGGTGAGKEKRP